MFKRLNSTVQRDMRSTEAASHKSSFDMFLELSHDTEQRLDPIAREYPVIRIALIPFKTALRIRRSCSARNKSQEIIQTYFHMVQMMDTLSLIQHMNGESVLNHLEERAHAIAVSISQCVKLTEEATQFSHTERAEAERTWNFKLSQANEDFESHTRFLTVLLTTGSPPLETFVKEEFQLLLNQLVDGLCLKLRDRIATMRSSRNSQGASHAPLQAQHRPDSLVHPWESLVSLHDISDHHGQAEEDVHQLLSGFKIGLNRALFATRQNLAHLASDCGGKLDDIITHKHSIAGLQYSNCPPDRIFSNKPPQQNTRLQRFKRIISRTIPRILPKSSVAPWTPTAISQSAQDHSSVPSDQSGDAPTTDEKGMAFFESDFEDPPPLYILDQLDSIPEIDNDRCVVCSLPLWGTSTVSCQDCLRDCHPTCWALHTNEQRQCSTRVVCEEHEHEVQSIRSSSYSQIGSHTFVGTGSAAAQVENTVMSPTDGSASATLLNPELPLYTETPELGLVVNNSISNDYLGNLLAVNIGTLLDTAQDKREWFLNLKGSLALHYLEALQAWLDQNPAHHQRSRGLHLLIELASRSETVPQSMYLTDVIVPSMTRAWPGGFADVYQGQLRGQKVAVKRLRGSAHARAQIHRSFCKEGLLWRQLEHPNILPFLGVDRHTFGEDFCMVSPWMEKGTLMEFLASPDYSPSMDRMRLIIEIASGVSYLHQQQLAHGDLHGSNVFIDGGGHVRLADFGLTVMLNLSRTQSYESAGAAQWVPPEFHNTNDNRPRRTLEGDVFSFGRVAYAICTRRTPYAGLSTLQVILQVIKAVHPAEPTEDECSGVPMPDGVWQTITSCWAKDPLDRPRIGDILANLSHPTSLSSNVVKVTKGKETDYSSPLSSQCAEYMLEPAAACSTLSNCTAPAKPQLSTIIIPPPRLSQEMALPSPSSSMAYSPLETVANVREVDAPMTCTHLGLPSLSLDEDVLDASKSWSAGFSTYLSGPQSHEDFVWSR